MRKNKLFSILSLAVLIAMMVNICFTGIAFAAEDSGNPVKQNGLQNTAYLLKNGTKFTVGYFGGSITAGFGASDGDHCYAGLTYKWIKDTYAKNKDNKDIDFKVINAGWGGTGTSHGAYRADSVLKLGTAQQPDLTFVEFAINDKYDKVSYDEAAANMETIVRKLYKANPKMDIVILFTTDLYSFDYENNANAAWKEWDALKAHQEIADRYGIPTIYVGKTLNEKIFAENSNKVPRTDGGSLDPDNAVWKKYIADTVHPTDAGYAVYAEEIEKYITEQVTANANVTEQKEMTLGGAKYGVQEDAYYASVDAHNPVGNQWKKGTSAQTNKPLIYADGANQVLHFSFTGTGADIHTENSISENFGTLTVYVDGVKKTVAVNAVDRMINIATGLENKKHDVVIITNDDTIPSGSSIMVDGIGIMGDSSKSGVKFNLDSEKVYITEPAETLKGIDFMTRIEGYKRTNDWWNEGASVISSEGGKDADGNAVSATAEKYRAPMFFKYDLSAYKGRTIGGARLFAKLKESNYCLKLYDVPGDDLTYIKNGVCTRIPVNTTSISESWSGSANPVEYYLDADDSRINISDYNISVDMTASYISEQINSQNSTATFALMDAWAGVYWVDGTPMLMLDMSYNANTDVTLSTAKNGDDITATLLTAVSSSTAGIADVVFYVDGTEYKGAVTQSNGEYSVTLAGYANGSHSIKAKAVDIYGNVTEKTIDIGTVKTDLIAMQGDGYKYVTDYYQYDQAGKGKVWGFGQTSTYPVATAEATSKEDIVNSTYAYMQYDLSKVDFENVDSAYLVYSARKGTDDLPVNKVDFYRCSSFTADTIKNSDNTPNKLPAKYEPISTGVALNANQLTEADKDYETLKNNAKTAADNENTTAVLYKLDISDYFKANAEAAVKDGSNFGIQVTKNTGNGSGVIEFRSGVYLFVTYKAKIASDNGNSVTVTFNPSEYADNGTVTVFVADYDSAGNLIGAVKRDIAVEDKVMSFDVNKASGSVLTKVFMWKDTDTLTPITDAVIFEKN